MLGATVPAPIWGVTVDDISQLSQIVTALTYLFYFDFYFLIFILFCFAHNINRLSHQQGFTIQINNKNCFRCGTGFLLHYRRPGDT